MKLDFNYKENPDWLETPSLVDWNKPIDPNKGCFVIGFNISENKEILINSQTYCDFIFLN